MKPPHNVAELERALRKIGGTDETGYRLRCIMADVVAGQFLTGAVLRGGSSLKMRYGNETTRFTVDFDVARRLDEDDFIDRFNERLEAGWAGFSGRLVKEQKATPPDVAPEYVMQPFSLKLTYARHPWCTVVLEVAYNEIGDADEYDLVPVPDDIMDVFARLNFPAPSPIPVMRLEYQIAQKLHGATDVRGCRAQDLIDLQVIAGRENIDLARLRPICERLFANRKRQPWPSFVSATDALRSKYDYSIGNTAVIPDTSKAIEWINDLIQRIAQTS